MIGAHIKQLKEAISSACVRCGRDSATVQLVGISKTKPASAIRTAYEAGLLDIGENYVQEMLDKMEELKNVPVQWHFVGHLQTRKAKLLAGRVALIHSLDSLELAKAIHKTLAGKSVIQDCLVQINLAGEETKSGISENELQLFLSQLQSLEHVRVRGLMTLPPFFENPEQSRPYFFRLRQLLENINRNGCYREKLTDLSMGMSHDFGVAIEEGATLIRVGTAIFGERTYGKK